MDNTIEDFRQQLSNQFSAATALSTQDSQKTLFEDKPFPNFDLVFGEPKLELVKTQLQFFETCIATSDNESTEYLKDMLLESQQTIFSYAIFALKNNKITKEEFKKRAQNFANATNNQALKKQVIQASNNILGEELFIQ